MMEDRSGLFNEIQKFSQRALRKVETNVTTGLGEKVVEKRSAKGLKTLDNETDKSSKSAPGPSKLDLQVGLVIPGLMIGSQDVAHEKKVLEEYGITHIINLAEDEVSNSFEDEYNYLSMQVADSSATDLNKYLDDIYEFIDSGRFAGNCFVHCNASKPGLSRSSAICIAYLMYKEKRKFEDAYNEVKEARPFAKPNDSFITQLKKLDEQYNGAKKKEEIEDPFTKKKRMEIEAEKAMLKGTTSVKNKLQMFKKVEEDEKTRVTSPTPSKLRANGISWNPETSDDKENSEGGDKPVPKKLTSILSIFQSKDGSSVKPNYSSGLPKIAPSNAPVKKWKPVETKGLQRVKDPQVKFEPQKDYSAYERIKKSKSGVKWATKKDALKRTKSKEFKAAMKANNEATPSPKSSAPPLPPTSLPLSSSNQKSQSISSSKSVPSSAKSGSSEPPPPPPPPPKMDVEPKSQATKKLESPAANKTERPPLRKRPSQEDENRPSTRPALRRRPSQETQDEPVSTPPANSSRQLRRRSSQENTEISNNSSARPSLRRRQSQDNDETASTPTVDSSSRPTLRRRPSQETDAQAATPATPGETIYPWRKGRKSSEVNQEYNVNNKQESEVSPTSNQNLTAAKTNIPSSKPSEPSPVAPASESKPEEQPPKPKVYGVCRPKVKNIVGGSIWAADEKLTPKKDEVNKIHSKETATPPTVKATSTLATTVPETPKPAQHSINPVNAQSQPKSNLKSSITATSDKSDEDAKPVQRIVIIQQDESDEDEEDEEEDEEESEEEEEESEEESEEEEDSDEEEDDEEALQSKKSGLTRSSTAEILKLIKSKTKPEIAKSMEIIEEDEEIDVLLNELEKEGIENIDWGELGIELNEVKDIVENAKEEDEDDDEEEDEDEEDTQCKTKDEEEEEIENLLKNLEKEGIKEDLSDLEESGGKQSPISNVTITSKARTNPALTTSGKSSAPAKESSKPVSYIQKAESAEEEEEDDCYEEEVELVIEEDSD